MVDFWPTCAEPEYYFTILSTSRFYDVIIWKALAYRKRSISSGKRVIPFDYLDCVTLGWVFWMTFIDASSVFSRKLSNPKLS
jgi:hypothetical protein